ncbi:MAG: CoA transferase [Steroidobacteraceae bacterium]
MLDLSHALAGPYCTYQLMLLGAEIVKVANPKVGVDFCGRAPQIFDAVNAGKHSIVLDQRFLHGRYRAAARRRAHLHFGRAGLDC